MNLCDELTIRMLLERHGFHFSKSMGQNFLIDPQIPADIAAVSQADETCGVIRDTVKALYGEEAGENITIQYGGSMNDGNCAELLAKKNVDGGLIGGASLKADKFTVIVKAAN